MGRILAAIATLLILLLGAAFIAPAVVDWNQYRSDLEQAASSIIGRKVSAAGGIDISLLPEPRVRLGKVTVDESKNDRSRLTVESVDLTLSLQGLLGGRVEATAVKLVRPSLALDFLPSDQSIAKPTSAASSILMAAAAGNLEIEDGTVSITALVNPSFPGLTLRKIAGTLSAPAPGGAYRFNGRFLRGERPFDVKFTASAGAGDGVKVAGTIADVASKMSLQGDGLITIGTGPMFEGSITAVSPPAPSSSGASGIEVQAKAAAKISLTSMSLSDLAITLDPQNRAQILAGSGDMNFARERADFSLQARSLDVDALLATVNQTPYAGAAAADWSSLKVAADRLLWLSPNLSLRLSMVADQVQLRGELLEGVKIDAQRNAGRWVFEKFIGLLPGDTAFKVVGVLSGGDKPRLSASVSLGSKNVSRLARWAASSNAEAKVFRARALTVQGSMTLSDETTAFEGVTGSFEGTPFSASFHLDKGPVRSLVASLSGDSFDLSGIDIGQPAGAGPSPDGLIAALQAGVSRLVSSFSAESGIVETADLDISAGSIKTESLEAKNLAAHVKLSPETLTVSKLSVETTSGVAVRGEGSVLLKGTGNGRFEGRVEARSAQALSQLAALAGYDSESLGARQFEDFAPAAISVNYETGQNAGAMTALISGNLGAARFDGKAQLKGALADWKTGLLSVQLGASAVDGNRLLAHFLSQAETAQGAPLSPGTLALRMNGTAQRLDTSATIKTGLLQGTFDGTADLAAASPQFAGKLSASTPAPEEFMPSTVLVLLGGEPRTNLRVETNLTMTPSRFDANQLRVESAKNAVTGRLLLDISGPMPTLDADLKADRISAPALLAYFVSSGQGQPTVPTATSAAAVAPDMWGDQPFSAAAFKNASAKVSLEAKTIKLSDAISLTDGRAALRLQNGRLEVQKLEGKMLGGELAAFLSMEAQSRGIATSARLSLSNLDLANLPEPNTPQLLSGKASVFLTASGQALSPRGVISNLQGRGRLVMSDGQIYKLSPPAVQKSAEDLLAGQLPLTEEAITKNVAEASQSADFKFQHLKAPIIIRDGVLEIRRASFRNREGTIRMQAYLDIAKMQADSTWQAGVSSDKRAKYPPVKILISGPLRELGARPRSVAAEDFVRAVLVRKMEGDINRLENLNRPEVSATWSAKQEHAPLAAKQKKKPDNRAQQGTFDWLHASPPTPPKAPAPSRDFESRVRDALQGAGGSRSP